VDQIIWNNVPMQLWDYLKPYQKEGVQYAVKRGGRMLLADVQGLGKTIQVGVVNDLMHGA
jgi:SNF2 family DNA or RNA helicase